MKLCVTSYSFGHYQKENELGILGIIDKAAEMGFDAIEYAEGAWTKNCAPTLPEQIRDRAEACGIAVAALCMGADFINGSEGDLDAEIERMKTWVDFAVRMGAPKLRHDITRGFTGRKYSLGYDDALPRCAKATLAITQYAETKGIETMTENHGFFSQDAARVEKLINTVAHPNFGALVDVGNFMCADENPNVSVGLLAPYARHVHAKDFFRKSGMLPNPGQGWFTTRGGNYLRGTIIGHGDANVYQSINILKKWGYDGYVTVEFEGMEDNLLGIELGKKTLLSYLA